MPAKNSTKIYVENGYYHLYNRGVEKRNIFLDNQDYNVFKNYISEYLSPKDAKGLSKLMGNSRVSSLKKAKILRKLNLKNFNQEISLLAYCLMPNHFHFFLQQGPQESIDRFMSSLCTRYAMYFNRKYKRVGGLFQGVYKAVLINDEAQFLHITRYIHKQALAYNPTGSQNYPSSYPEYIEQRKTTWVHPEEILSFFSKTNPNFSYENFVAEYDPIDHSSSNEMEY